MRPNDDSHDEMNKAFVGVKYGTVFVQAVTYTSRCDAHSRFFRSTGRDMPPLSYTYSVLLADDHVFTMRGVASVLQDVHEVDVIAMAETGHDACDAVTEHLPDLLIVDLGLPGLNGFDVLAQTSEVSPDTRSVVFSSYVEDRYVSKAFQQGAYGYVLKGDPADDLVAVVENALLGRPAVSSSVPPDFLDRNVDIETRYDRLTPREREVFQLIVEGYTGPEIADRLFISPRTVGKHRENLMEKLDVSNVALLVRYAYETGVLPDFGNESLSAAPVSKGTNSES